MTVIRSGLLALPLLGLVLILAVQATQNAKPKVEAAAERPVKAKATEKDGKNKPNMNGYIMNEWDQEWPSNEVRRYLGQIGGVAEDPSGNVFIFHRADRYWDADDFNEKFSYVRAKYGPIESSTIVVVDRNSEVLSAFGENMFHLPHGISLDPNGGAVWVTDVAMHQVLKLERNHPKPTMTLGENLIPGSDDKHFCQPTSVVVSRSRNIFVADGYCNSRIMKFSANGTLLHKWGRKRQGNETLANDHLSIPHGLTLIEPRDLICVADREHGRVQCYRAGLKDPKQTGQFAFSVNKPEFGRVYAVNWNSAYDVLLILAMNHGVSRGYIYNMKSNKIIDNFDFLSRHGFGYGHTVSSAASGLSLTVGGLTKECPNIEEPDCNARVTGQNVWRFNMFGGDDLAALL